MRRGIPMWTAVNTILRPRCCSMRRARAMSRTLVPRQVRFVFILAPTMCSTEKKESRIRRQTSLIPYGISKLEGERLVRGKCDRHFIIRASGLYGLGLPAKRGHNFVETMIRLAENVGRIKIVDDQVMSPTSTQDLALKIEELLEKEDYGTYHITNSGECSWYRFGTAIFNAAGMSPDVVPVTSEEYGSRERVFCRIPRRGLFLSISFPD